MVPKSVKAFDMGPPKAGYKEYWSHFVYGGFLQDVAYGNIRKVELSKIIVDITLPTKTDSACGFETATADCDCTDEKLHVALVNVRYNGGSFFGSGGPHCPFCLFGTTTPDEKDAERVRVAIEKEIDAEVSGILKKHDFPFSVRSEKRKRVKRAKKVSSKVRGLCDGQED